MSGVFMDGGGHDQMGHGGEGFMDGGLDHDHGHDHGGHDHGGHDHGHEHGQGNLLAQALGLNNSNHHGHSFLSHLLGLDGDAHDHGHEGGQDGGQEGGAEQAASQSPFTHVSQMPIWTMALQGMKLSNFTDGIKISANFWLFLMFMGFIGWLFVVYWIRHHEPLANSVIGTAPAHSSTAAYDRKMISGIKEALPVRISPDGGEIYAPVPGNPKGSPGAAASAELPVFTPPSLNNQFMQLHNRSLSNQHILAPQHNFQPSAHFATSAHVPTYATFHPTFAGTHSSSFAPAQAPVYAPSPYAPIQSHYGVVPTASYQPQAPQAFAPVYQPQTDPRMSYAAGPSYNVPVISPDGARLRTVVNR